MKENKSKFIAIGITVIISGLLTYWGIEGIGVYGMALFILTPLFIGMCPVVIYGRKQPVTTKQARNIGFLTLGLFTVGLIVFAIEGLICIAMAAPIGLLLTWAGTLIGHSIVVKTPNNGTTTIIILILTIPTTAFVEKRDKETSDLIQVNELKINLIEKRGALIFKTEKAKTVTFRVH